MVMLKASIADWGSDRFATTFKHEVERLKNGDLPLTQGASISGYVDDEHLSVIMKHYSETDDELIVEFGIFFSEIIAGCSCGDDAPKENSYCDMRAVINKESTEALFEVIKPN